MEAFPLKPAHPLRALRPPAVEAFPLKLPRPLSPSRHKPPQDEAEDRMLTRASAALMRTPLWEANGPMIGRASTSAESSGLCDLAQRMPDVAS